MTSKSILPVLRPELPHLGLFNSECLLDFARFGQAMCQGFSYEILTCFPFLVQPHKYIWLRIQEGFKQTNALTVKAYISNELINFLKIGLTWYWFVN